MADKSWKAEERFIGRRLGTRRMPSRGSGWPDLATELFAVECKERKYDVPKWLIDAWEQAVTNAAHYNAAERDGDDPIAPVVVFTQRNGRGRAKRRFVLIDFATFAAMHDSLTRVDPRQHCRYCGCTDDAGCVDGCSWVTDDVCSVCHAGGRTAAYDESWRELIIADRRVVIEHRHAPGEPLHKHVGN